MNQCVDPACKRRTMANKLTDARLNLPQDGSVGLVSAHAKFLGTSINWLKSVKQRSENWSVCQTMYVCTCDIT